MIGEKAAQIFMAALLAAFGALARFLSQKDKEAARFAGLISGSMVAAFSGIMTHFISDYFGLDPSLNYLLAGVSGWMGPQLMDAISDMVLKKMGIK